MSGNKRESIVSNIEALPKDDAVDLYYTLGDLYSSVKQELDERTQELHQQKSQTKLLLSSQIDLQSELDSLTSTHNEELNEVKRSSNSVIEGLKDKNRELTSDKLQLESAVEELTKHLVESQKLTDDLQFQLSHRKPALRYSDSSNKFLEAEMEELKLTLSEMNGSVRGKSEVIKEQRSQLHELKEKLMCLEDNLESKKSELDEKNDLIEALQEKIQEAIVEIATLKSSPEDASKFRQKSNVKFRS